MINQKQLQNKSRLGTILLNRQLISQDQLSQALFFQSQHQVRLGEALLSLGMIDQKQLSRALRKQSWLRSTAAAIALIVAPFSPAYAASQGSMGKTSSASSQISVTILPKSLAASDGDLVLSEQQSTLSEGICTTSLGVSHYSVTASGSGKNGEFELTDESQDSIPYSVEFEHPNSQATPLKASEKTRSFQQVQVKGASYCSEDSQSRVKVSLEPDTGLAEEKIFAGTLTLTIAAE